MTLPRGNLKGYVVDPPSETKKVITKVFSNGGKNNWKTDHPHSLRTGVRPLLHCDPPNGVKRQLPKRLRKVGVLIYLNLDLTLYRGNLTSSVKSYRFSDNARVYFRSLVFVGTKFKNSIRSEFSSVGINGSVLKILSPRLVSLDF